VRALASTLLIATLSLGTTACSLSGNVASLQPYAPSDGQQVNLETVKARNFIYLVAESGRGYLIGSFVNSANQDKIVKLQYVNSSDQSKSEYFFDVPAGAKIDFGYNGFPAIDAPVVEVPGQTAQFFVLESDTVNGSMRVPVLDGTLSEYKALLEQLEALSAEAEAEAETEVVE
jgi:hypothetical protein